ncbi:cobalt-zinc-cadmium resistance protein CzcA [Fluviicoccus keumensis]|uniref:Cobalt-zinc-cadmium resistance protein CzcA n=1 Tax=Fluviicoccus keumensis TaxID=1435465 RepID=A0A4Q7YN23_9GAMM|nr:CusA/CzcA family heavy metal efflux RND transporter [Fluviicoccus keumensis]RZU38243.1 cobalt-zinc-cadmium resistance protein CzcA [Fluviicoccus keumensis]
MIRRLISFALHQKLFVWLGLALFVAGGLSAFVRLPVEAFPDVSDMQVNIIGLYPGHAAEEVEKQVTLPIERALSGTPHMVRLFSHTQPGLSYTVLTFDDALPEAVVRQQVNERLRDADLPAGVQADVQPPSTSIGEIYRFRLRGDFLSPQELRTIEDWDVEKYIRQVPGVADLVTMGGAIKQYEVNPDLARMRDANVTLNQLFTALQRANGNTGGGAVTQGQQQYLIRTLGAFKTSADIERVVVAVNAGVPILVRDIARVTIGEAPRQGIVGQDNMDDVIQGIVVMRKGENPSLVLTALKDKVAYINAHVLPAGVRIEPFYDRSWLIEKTLHTVFHNLLEGASLVLAVLLLFLGNLRAALIVVTVIPLALLATFLGLTFMGIPANLLSLGAMDFGIIVDGAVIVIENIFRRLGELDEAEMADSQTRLRTILHAAAEVGRPTVFSMVIIIAAHIPIFTLQRHEGRIFSPMAYSVTSALIGSLLMSLTLVPVLSHLFLRKNISHEENRLVRWCKAAYEPVLRWALDHKKAVLGTALAALAASMVLATRLGTEFLPELNEGAIWVNVFIPSSVSPQEAMKEARAIREALHSVPEVGMVISKFGRPDDGTDPKIFNSGEFLVNLKPESQWRKGKTKEDLLAEMDKAVSRFPGTDTSFSQPIRDNVLESISQIDGQVVIKLRGEDLDELKRSAHHILGIISAVPGVQRAFVDRDGDLPQYVMDFDRDAAARYGVNVSDVEDMVEMALAGKATSELWEGEKHFSVAVRLTEPERSLDNVANLLVATPDGRQVPLGQLVHFRQASGAMNIARENGSRVVAIGVFIHGRDMGSAVKDMQAKVAANLKTAPGDEISWSGEFENQQRAMARLAIVVPLSVVVIFLLLFNAFNSFKNAVLIISNIPFALIGGIVALFVLGIPLSVSAAIGFIALFGQAVLNGVVMVSQFNQLHVEQGMALREAVLSGALERLRTVLMTALLAMLGLLPMALSHAIGSETQRPLAVVVIGGLVTATLLTLVVLPTLYEAIIDRWQEDSGGDD